MEPVMDVAGLTAFLAEAFPEVDGEFAVDTVTDDGVMVRLLVGDRHLRPGGTVSGPAMFSLADVGVYLAVLSRIGPVALAVTTNCSIDFMRKPVAAQDLVATVRLLKLGKRLAVGDVLIRSAGETAIVARASLTYAIPDR
ncbi:PaaI family thioesterase [Yoonia sp. R2331]|uniref:PaaI family thioesterase n=1 Tax=Yoonia sp. R2331 TaxID=3237238 RepID=UPI0034E5346D